MIYEWLQWTADIILFQGCEKAPILSEPRAFLCNGGEYCNYSTVFYSNFTGISKNVFWLQVTPSGSSANWVNNWGNYFNTRNTTTMCLCVWQFRSNVFNVVNQKANTLQNTEIKGIIEVPEMPNLSACLTRVRIVHPVYTRHMADTHPLKNACTLRAIRPHN
jgi:hypothetical protein